MPRTEWKALLNRWGLLCVTLLVCGCLACGGAAEAENATALAAQPDAGADAAGQVVVLEEETRTTSQADVGQADFHYYSLALSWSPQHCATPAGRGDRTQCAGPRPFGFIVHGLWPQYERGWPQDCGGPRLEQTTVRGMMDIMPSERLVRHEWSKHGTCSGLAPADYFALTRKAFEGFQTPTGYGTPDSQLSVAPAKYKQALLAANPSLQARGVALICSGRFLQEVRLCLDKNLRPRACGGGVRDRCNVPEMIVQPLR